MKIVVANSIGRLDNGQQVILFPSRWDSAVKGDRPFAYYPYELAYLSSLLKRDTDHNVKMLDGNLNLLGADEYADVIAAEKPKLLITECSALTYPAMTRAALAVKQRTGCDIWLTGPLATYDPNRCLKDGWDKTFRGEFELNVLETVTGNLPGAPGYINLDFLPWPEDTDISRIDYSEMSNPVPGLIQVYPTRGCPLACTFCVVPLYYGGHGNSHKSHRQRDVDNVCDEIEHLAVKYDGFNGCFFNEEAHNANPQWLEQFATRLIQRGLNCFTYDAMCGYWNYTQPLVELLAQAGYRQIRFGVESTSEVVGKQIRKTMHLERLERFMGWCRTAGIDCYGTFQIGAPGATEETDLQTIADLRRWAADGLMQRWQVSTSTPQPGTPFYQQAVDEGWLQTDDLSHFDGERAVLSFPGYPAERIEKVRAMA